MLPESASEGCRQIPAVIVFVLFKLYQS